MNRLTLPLVALLALSGCCGPIAAAPLGVHDGSTTAADGTRTLRQSVVVPAPVAAVWHAFTTTEGYRAWAAPVAEIDFRVGGIIETSYSVDASIGAPGNIRNEIIAFAPERMFAIRNRQAPPDVAFDVPTFQSLQTIVLLDELDGALTRVTIVQPGYRTGDTFARIWTTFEWGNGTTLAALRDRFVKGPVDWPKQAR